MNRRHVTHPPRRRRGFSLVETVIAVAVLGIGAVLVLRLFVYADRGASTNRSMSIAQELAAQRLDRLAAEGMDALPAACGAALGTPIGCRASISSLADPKGDDASGYHCTQMVDETSVPDPSMADSVASKYRVDTHVASHPDSLRYPEARIVTVSVCWQGDAGRVFEVQGLRIVVPTRG